MTTLTFPNDVRITGNLQVGGTLSPERPRSNLARETLVAYPIPWTAWRTFDALGTPLPATPANDDLGLVGGTHGTNTPSLQTADKKTAGATNVYARCQLILPDAYEAGRDVRLQFHAGMNTAAADNSATLDASVYKSDEEAGVGSELVTTDAQDINNLTLADFIFVVNKAGLSRGDLLDLLVTIAINDASGGSPVIGMIGAAYLLCDIRG